MSLYRYTAMDKAGKTVASAMEAESEAALSTFLKQNGLFLMQATLLKAAAKKAEAGPATAATLAAAAPGAAPPKPTGWRKKSVPIRSLVAFTSQFGLLIKSSLPVLQALSSLTLQEKDPLLVVTLFDVQERVKRGESLSHAFGAHNDVFGEVYISLLGAGEATGKLAPILQRIKEYLEFQADVARKIRSAMIYPALVLGASLTVVLFLLLFVLPHFIEIFGQFNAALPLPTRILVAMSVGLREHALVIFPGTAAAAWLAWRWVRQPSSRERLDPLLLSVPVVGPMIEAIVITRILRLMEVLLQSGVPILKTLELCRTGANHRYYQHLLERVIQHVSEGKGIASGFYGSPHFPHSMADLIRTAEKTGTMVEVLQTSSAHYQKGLDANIQDAFSAMEPLFIGFLSVVVAGIAICIMLPMLELGTLVE